MKPALFTLALLVAKWLCQNSVIFSRSGCALCSMRYSHHADACGPALNFGAAGGQELLGLRVVDGAVWPPLSSWSMSLSGPSFNAGLESLHGAPERGPAVEVADLLEVPRVVRVGLYGCQARRGSIVLAMTRQSH